MRKFLLIQKHIWRIMVVSVMMSVRHLYQPCVADDVAFSWLLLSSVHRTRNSGPGLYAPGAQAMAYCSLTVPCHFISVVTLYARLWAMVSGKRDLPTCHWLGAPSFVAFYFIYLIPSQMDFSSMPSRKELGGIENCLALRHSNQVLFLFLKDRKAACVHGGGGVHRL